MCDAHGTRIRGLPAILEAVASAKTITGQLSLAKALTVILFKPSSWTILEISSPIASAVWDFISMQSQKKSTDFSFSFSAADDRRTLKKDVLFLDIPSKIKHTVLFSSFSVMYCFVTVAILGRVAIKVVRDGGE